MQKNESKKLNIIAMVALIICICSFVVGGSFAYFTDMKRSTSNVITFGQVDITSSVKTLADGNSSISFAAADMKPSNTISRKIYVYVEDDSVSCYVRMWFDFRISDSAINSGNFLAAETSNAVTMSLNDDEDDWQEGVAYGYYYKDVVTSGNSACAIVDFNFSANVSNVMQGKHFGARIYIESIQSLGGDEGEPYETEWEGEHPLSSNGWPRNQ